MRNKLITIVLCVLLAASLAFASAQQTTFAWVGSTDSSQLVELATINGQPVNQATGYGGAIQIVNGSWLWLLELPESLGFPNNGFLDCETAIAFGAKQWGTRADGSQMDGTQPGDSYTLTGTTSCSLWNGTTSISIKEFRQMVQHRSCYRGACKTYLVDTMENGSGSATVD